MYNQQFDSNLSSTKFKDDFFFFLNLVRWWKLFLLHYFRKMLAFIKLCLVACLCSTIVIAVGAKTSGITTSQRSSRGSIPVEQQTTVAITTDNSKQPTSSRKVTSHSTQRPGTTPGKLVTTTNAADTRSIALTTMLVSVMGSLAYMIRI